MTVPTPQEAVTGWIIIGTIGSFVCALACMMSDHMLPWLSAWLTARWRDPWESRCAEDPECMLPRGHSGSHLTDEYL